jgi:H+/gluconate symporter-like permease
MELLSILVSLGLLMLLAYRGISVLILAPLMALLAVLLGGQFQELLPIYTQVFMKAMGAYIIQYFPLFLLGSIFGKLMESSGHALTLANFITEKLGAQRALLAVALSCAILTYGGVSLFVVAFMMYPIGQSLFERANISKNLLPAAIALGAFTFTMTSLPGTPSVQNSIPSPYFGTDSFAAPGLGLIASVLMAALGIWWLNLQSKNLGAPNKLVAQIDNGSASSSSSSSQAAAHSSFKLALMPIVIMGITNLIMAKWLLPNWQPEFLTGNDFGISSITSVSGLWAIIIALCAGILYIYWHSPDSVDS